jgi:hypothetical protein
MGKRKTNASAAPITNVDPPSGLKRPKPDIPRQLPWSDNHDAKTYAFIAQMEEYENFKVLFGKADSSDVCLLSQ